jgi:hypothetical protein
MTVGALARYPERVRLRLSPVLRHVGARASNWLEVQLIRSVAASKDAVLAYSTCSGRLPVNAKGAQYNATVLRLNLRGV